MPVRLNIAARPPEVGDAGDPLPAAFDRAARLHRLNHVAPGLRGAGVEVLAEDGPGDVRCHGAAAAAIDLQVVKIPIAVGLGVDGLVVARTGAALARVRRVGSIQPKLQASGVNSIGDGPHAGRKHRWIFDDGAVAPARNLPTIIQVDIPAHTAHDTSII